MIREAAMIRLGRDLSGCRSLRCSLAWIWNLGSNYVDPDPPSEATFMLRIFIDTVSLIYGGRMVFL